MALIEKSNCQLQYDSFTGPDEIAVRIIRSTKSRYQLRRRCTMNTLFNPKKLGSPLLISMIAASAILLGLPNSALAAGFHHFGHRGHHYGYPYSYGRYSYGYPYSYGRYSNAYRSDRVPRDYADAVKSNHKDAERGNANAQYNLGVMYSQGLGVTQDHAEAVKWYRKAAEQGLADAQYNLGVMYSQGLGVTQDHAEAVKWYRKAAAQGAKTKLNNSDTSG